ncbi:hypothetical protein DU508_22615 [Pedobacter chinensis]|uniref:histidine kinase n=1 Tax=Pedobacter chinensis TaxID=2282421 RepID=A0A369PNV9_9SPHI|nr:ATP-binding protein [Pedobacter chinensis]RDC54283.1 hypothetical protein DU508_22615 [Pedobacter chinensis]
MDSSTAISQLLFRLPICASLNFSWINGLILLVVLLAVGYIAYILYKNYKFGSARKNEYIAQSQAIKLERQRISSEIHDELGSGLSAIKLYSELAAKNRPEIIELQELNEMVKEISTKINDIIWTTSTENDHLDSVIFYIQEQIGKLFRHSEIKFESNLPEYIPAIKFKSESRRDFYLLSKEIAHNALKHSNADLITVNISLNPELITLSIRDNGVGFDPLLDKKNGMGLSNINQRVERLNGSLTIENYKGTKVLVNIPILGNFYEEAE